MMFIVVALALIIPACAPMHRGEAASNSRRSACSKAGNDFIRGWQECGDAEHRGIVTLMLANELRFQVHSSDGAPYEVTDKNGSRYFVDLQDVQIVRRPDDSGFFVLPLRSQNGTTYKLRWRIHGEFDKYMGSSPVLPNTN